MMIVYAGLGKKLPEELRGTSDCSERKCLIRCESRPAIIIDLTVGNNQTTFVLKKQYAYNPRWSAKASSFIDECG